jgi:hypothetical protein
MADDSERSEELSAKARDLVYTAVGFGVLAVQRLQVIRRDVMRDVRGNIKPLVRSMQAVVDPALDVVEGRLPFPGRLVFRDARQRARRFQESWLAEG